MSTAFQPGPTETNRWISKTPIASEAEDLATFCVICNHNCGVRVNVADGKITKVTPDKSNPFSRGHACNKAASIPFLLEHPQRVQHPLKRRSDGSFERITWNQAVTEIAAKLRQLADDHGGRSIGALGMGGQGNHMGGQPFLLMQEFLGSKRWFCAYAQEKTQHHLVEQWMFDAPSTMMFVGDVENTRYLLSVGSNPKVSNLMRNHAEALKGVRKGEDRRLVVVDPRVSDMCKDADRHIAIRPGSDSYFFLGMLKTLIDRDLIERGWLEANTVGLAEVEKAVEGVDVEEMARRCDIEASEIVETAIEFAGAPSACIEAGLGAEHVWFSTLVSYLIRLIVSITGNAGKAGGHVYVGNITPPSLAADRFDDPPRTVAAGIRGVRAISPFHMFSPTLVPEEIQNDHPDRIRGLICDTSNPLIAFSDVERWRKALAELELLVVVDMSMTETARQAHYVLPAAGAYQKWEYADFPKTWPEITFQLRQPSIPIEQGSQAKPEPEIYISIIREMGVFREVPAELHELAKECHSASGAGAFMMRALELAQKFGDPDPTPRLGFWAYETVGPHLPTPAIAPVWISCMLNGLFRPHVAKRSLAAAFAEADAFEIGTELFKRIIEHPEGVEIGRFDPQEAWQEQLGWEDKKIRLAPDEVLREVRRAIDTDLSVVDPDHPFLVSVGVRTRWTANAIHRNPQWRKGRGPHCTLHMSDADASELGLANGDMVRVSSPVGSITLPAEVEKGVKSGHAWLPNGFGMIHGADGAEEVVGANGNRLTDIADRDPITGCPHHKAVRCKIEKVAQAA